MIVYDTCAGPGGRCRSEETAAAASAPGHFERCAAVMRQEDLAVGEGSAGRAVGRLGGQLALLVIGRHGCARNFGRRGQQRAAQASREAGNERAGKRRDAQRVEFGNVDAGACQSREVGKHTGNGQSEGATNANTSRTRGQFSGSGTPGLMLYVTRSLSPAMPSCRLGAASLMCRSQLLEPVRNLAYL